VGIRTLRCGHWQAALFLDAKQLVEEPGLAMNVVFDIFRGTTRANGIWLESVEGLSNSKDRMHKIAAQKPGCYFVFASHDQSIRARTETKGSGGGTVGSAYSR
jgi:hypothetical protein